MSTYWVLYKDARNTGKHPEKEITIIIDHVFPKNLPLAIKSVVIETEQDTISEYIILLNFIKLD